MQIFVKLIKRFNSPVYFAPPCTARQGHKPLHQVWAPRLRGQKEKNKTLHFGLTRLTGGLPPTTGPLTYLLNLFRSCRSGTHLDAMKMDIKSVNGLCNVGLTIVDKPWLGWLWVHPDMDSDLKVVFLLAYERVVMRQIAKSFVRIDHVHNWTTGHTNTLIKNVKFSHTHYRALGPELILEYRQSARR